MNMNNELSEVLEVLEKSPIRKVKKDSEKKVIFLKEEIDRTDEIYNVISINRKNLINPIKIVLMGEVKAGKSTLLNALVGEEISYMNVVEATATILEVKYGNQIKATICKKNDENVDYSSIQELNSLLDSKRSDMDYFSTISKIVIELPLERLKEITIVDTPGLNTITIENAERTENYILNSDVILWVLNGHHLGQSDVHSKINEVRRLGKPILCVINRIDEIECDKNELIEYVDSEMGYIFKEIFALSARQGLEGVLQNNDEMLNLSGLNYINKYILENIEKDSQNVQQNSIEESTITQIIREMDIHKYYLLRLDKLLNGIITESKEINNFNKTLMISIKDRLDQWINYELFSEEKKILLKSSNLNEDIKKYFNENYINKIIEDKYNELSLYIYDEWKMYEKNLTYEKRQAIKESISLARIEKNLSNQAKGNFNEDTLDSCAKGLTTAGAIGLGLAGYAAWLGPAAAYVTIGGAIGVFLPPVLIAGAIGGSVLGFFKRGNSNTKKISELEGIIEQLKNNVNLNVKNTLINNLNDASKVYENKLLQNSQHILIDVDITFDEAAQIVDDIYSYLEILKSIATKNFHIKEELILPKKENVYDLDI